MMFARLHKLAARLLVVLVLSACGPVTPGDYDVIIRGGSVYDGSGNDPVVTDVAISADRIERVGDLSSTRRKDGRWSYFRLTTEAEHPQAAEAALLAIRSLGRDSQVREDRRRLKQILNLDPEELCRNQSSCKC